MPDTPVNHARRPRPIGRRADQRGGRRVERMSSGPISTSFRVTGDRQSETLPLRLAETGTAPGLQRRRRHLDRAMDHGALRHFVGDVTCADQRRREGLGPPHLIGAVCAGDISFDKMRAVADVATPETDEGLKEQAQRCTVRELADVARTMAQVAASHSPASSRSDHDRRFVRFNDHLPHRDGTAPCRNLCRGAHHAGSRCPARYPPTARHPGISASATPSPESSARRTPEQGRDHQGTGLRAARTSWSCTSHSRHSSTTPSSPPSWPENSSGTA